MKERQSGYWRNFKRLLEWLKHFYFHFSVSKVEEQTLQNFSNPLEKVLMLCISRNDTNGGSLVRLSGPSDFITINGSLMCLTTCGGGPFVTM